MFIHNLLYDLKILLKNKNLIFWTFAFPIVLGVLFNMAFSKIEDGMKLDVFDIAIVESDNFSSNDYYIKAYKSLSEGEDKLFNIKYTNLKDAKELLLDKKITGYIEFLEIPVITIKENGINETVLSTVTEEIIRGEVIANNVVENEIRKENFDYDAINTKVNEVIKISKDVIEDKSSKNLSITMIEYYTLIAMSALYGGIISMTSLNYSIANMSNNGKRVSIAPTKKSTVILSSLTASYLIQIIGIAVLMLFTVFVLKVDFGDNLLRTIIMALLGSFAGLSLGTFIASVFKISETSKIGIIIGITMLYSFLSGMMGMTLKYYVDTHANIINKINPAAMITDGFYSLYYYETSSRYFFNLISLSVYSIVLLIISYISLRRQKYDSI